jgi:putative glutamine amidotransferase
MLPADTITVALTQRVLPANDFGEQRLALDVRWSEFLASCGVLGVPVPADPVLAEATIQHTHCAGIILTGGDDLAEVGGATPQRDRLERYLLAAALALDLPVLGVCRGMQLLLHAFGADLVRVDGHVATTHQLTGQLGGREVNSFHRWATTQAPAEFEVTAGCGQTIEAVKLRGRRAVGIMWHPERVNPPHPADIALVTQLFREAS